MLEVSVTSSNTGVATVSPSSVEFASCDDVHALTITPVGVGSTDITIAQTLNTTSGTFDLAHATFTVNVSGALALGLLVGINLVFGGTSLIGMALAARNA